MNKRFVVIVIDGFGIGAMKDAEHVRPGDERSNTLGSLLKKYPELKLPTLEKMGLMNAYGKESLQMKFSESANYGKSELMHYGADTFMGHQEIMGTCPKKPAIHSFQENIDTIYKHLKEENHKIEMIQSGCLRYLLVDDYCVVADNIDTDPGMAFNCTAPLDFMPFEEVLKIGQQVREVTTLNRIIVLGGTHTTIEDVLRAEVIRENKYIGIHAVKSKSYEKGYRCRHLGYGVDNKTQTPYLLTSRGINVSLFGKVADIILNEKGKSVSCVDTKEVLNLTIEEVKTLKYGFICTNVQETDLAGHSQDAKWYMELVKIVDAKIAEIITYLNKEDILIIMADHGNDPEIGHNRHTRENVPLLILHGDVKGINIGLRKTLSDVGATVCDFFKVEAPEQGTSFLGLIEESKYKEGG